MKCFQKKEIPHLFLTLSLTAIFIFMLCISLNCASAYADEMKGTIKIGGSGHALGAFRKLGDGFRKLHPDVNFVILPSLGSGGGIKAVNERALDIGLSARQLKDTERKQGTAVQDFARTPFVFVVSGKPAAISLSLKDIVKIYSGMTTSWPNGTPVRIVLRPEADADTDLLKSMSTEIKEAVRKAMSREGMALATSDQENADLMEKVPGSFGTSTFGQLISEKRPLTVVTIDGVVPGLKNLAAGKYPYSKPLLLVTSIKSSPLTRYFIEFITSREGKSILEKDGFLLL